MAIENIIQFIIAAKNQASPVLQQVNDQLKKTEKQAGDTGNRLNRGLSLGAAVARAGLLSLASAGTIVGAALFQLWTQADEAASGLAALTEGGIENIPKLRDEILKLAGKNDNPFSDIVDAVKTVETTFKIFDPKDKEGLAQMLLDWKDVTGQTAEEAGKDFRKIILLYFGADADPNKAFTEIADKILAVSQALGLDPKGLATAISDLGVAGKNYFGNLDSLLEFVGAMGYASGDITLASKALEVFAEKVAEVRQAWKAGEDPSAATLEAFKTLGLSRETIQNEGMKIGDMIMMSLKHAMKDGKISDEELQALNFLFGKRVGEDMALTAKFMDEGLAKGKQVLLGPDGWKGTFEKAAAAADDNLNGKIAMAWRNLVISFTKTDTWKTAQNVVLAFLDTLVSLFSDKGDKWKEIKKNLENLGLWLVKAVFGYDAKALAERAKEFWGNIGKAIDKGLEVSGLKAVGGAIWDFLKEGWAAAQNDGAKGVIAFLKNRFAEWRKGFGEWWNNMLEIGKNLIAGLWKGITQAWEDAKKRVSQMGADFIQWWKDVLGIKSPSKEFEAIGFFIIQGLTNGLDQALPGLRSKIEGIVGVITSTINQLGPAITNLANTGWTEGWSAMGSVMQKALEDIGRYTDETTASTLKTWGGYINQFAVLMDKYKGNILKALADLLIGIVEQKLIEIAVTAAAEIAKAALMAPLTFGATLAATGPILAASAAGIIALEALKGRILGSFDMGTPYVPYDQIAQIHQGEMIIPRTFAEGIRSGDVALGGDGTTIVQVWLDGRMITEQVGRRMYNGVRSLVKADIPVLTS